MIRFSIEARLPNGRGRAGTIETPHGRIQTPAFIPVATKATIKSLTPEMVRDQVGAQAVLANTYHLYLEPGADILRSAGGLGKFMNWKGPTFTDSGGFQAFSLGAAWGKGIGKVKKQAVEAPMSLQARGEAGRSGSDDADEAGDMHARLAKIDDDGVTFRSVIDGSTHRFTPESSIDIQHDIGADIIFAFDECLSPHESYERQKAAVERTRLWAERCLVRHEKLAARSQELGSGLTQAFRTPSSKPPAPSLFGIVQGGRHKDLREESARAIGAMDVAGASFEGFGIGGSFDKDDIGTAVGWVADILPENKPRHLLGIGSEPEDLILGIENGIDTFDCVAPTRIARNGSAYVRRKEYEVGSREGRKAGRINLLNAQYAADLSPIDPACACHSCKNYTRAYVSHLFHAKEMLAATLVSIHNLYFVVNLVKEARKAIVEGKWEEFKAFAAR